MFLGVDRCFSLIPNDINNLVMHIDYATLPGRTGSLTRWHDSVMIRVSSGPDIYTVSNSNPTIFRLSLLNSTPNR
jgi:hypothetical protein